MEIHINHLAILVNRPPQVVQRVLWVPETNCFPVDRDTSFSKEVFNIPVAQVEAIAEPD